jgi:hypothetical protein
MFPLCAPTVCSGPLAQGSEQHSIVLWLGTADVTVQRGCVPSADPL